MADAETPKTSEVPEPAETSAKEPEKAETEITDKVEVSEEVKPAQAAGDRKWYVIQTLTGQEERVKAAIERNIEGAGLQKKVFRVLIPEEEIVEIRDGKRVEKIKKMYPGYVFVEMVLDENTWHIIRQTPGVARFIGSKTSPTPVSDREIQRVLRQLGVKEAKVDIAFGKGEAIRIISGPFRGYTGTVDEVNFEKSKIKALVNIFGRDTPVEIDFEQAEKVV